MGLLDWWRVLAFNPHPVVPCQRTVLAMVMCRWCARRWLAGRRIPHPGCAEELGYAFDLYLHRPR